MPEFNPHLLLDVPRYPDTGYALLADRIKRMLGTSADVVFVQAEAILALEAVAASIARPGAVAVNVVTSPYGTWFGTWLRRGGATVYDVVAEAGQPVTLSAVSGCLDTLAQVDIVAAVHAESSSGVLNPLAELAALAQSRNALFAVDAVASVGGHAIDIDGLGIDITVIGPQKALAGPAGVSAVVLGKRAWAHIESTPDFAPSSLSLAALKQDWLERGRAALPGTPSALEFWALEAALDRIEAEGIERVIARHQLAARATRAALRSLGVAPWIEREDAASALVTSAPIPAGIDGRELIGHALRHGSELTPGFGDVSGQMVRLNHTGLRATPDTVLANVLAYGKALEQLGRAVDLDAAQRAVAHAYAR
ncbi:MAG: aminotransferase class V-fold PLP-dependent enzyme [Pseudomonadota bacterium]|jgi:aspartate aminotransferase-like enzyme|uniref:pyridoxal-phosphate-dependent aminotransferase family protein n=2 Tax=Burkholderiales TaxID=80840 RepID=UPI0010F750D3|nr:aminotransferase class V-fold PLP-dependent enzyme [Burkholderia sp. 4M9327F10]